MATGGKLSDRYLYGPAATVRLADLEHGSALQVQLQEFRGRNIAVLTRDQLAFAILMTELDGVARRVVLCPPDLPVHYFPLIIREAAVDIWIGDTNAEAPDGCAVLTHGPLAPRAVQRRCSEQTEWVLLTSGTMGVPKLVAHTLASLVNSFIAKEPLAPGTVWSTFYDIRRYGGLQAYLRGLCGGSLAVSAGGESIVDFLTRAGATGVTHISGTPSHWRKALMSGAISCLAPKYVRLSGEIADQGILDALARAFPEAIVAHAFASTEAGVGFEVRDGYEGFPVRLIDSPDLPVEIDVSEGLLRLRSSGNAHCYLGTAAPSLKSADGFVATGDRVERRHDRYHFLGRSDGIINVGGQKVHPEEVESVINCVPWVHISRVTGRRNPISGALVMAEVVRNPNTELRGCPPSDEQLACLISDACRQALLPYKVPATVKFVPHLEVAPSGKLVRSDA